MKLYSCGFIFNPDRTETLFIRKNRPEWQLGKFNGIGGKVEEGESFLEAMIRESHEETTIRDENWKDICRLFGDGFACNFFAIYNQDFNKIRALTDEELYPFNIKDIYNPHFYFYNDFMKNLRVMIALALDDSGLKLPFNLYQ